MERKVEQGQFYRHFKGKLYQVLAVAEHSETKEKMVVYQALYGSYGVYVRPYDMFVSEVDREKYPDVQQKYRFLQVTPGADSGVEAQASVQEVSVEELSVEEPQRAAVEAEEEPQVNPLLLEFLDADTYADKLQLFVSFRNRMDQQLLESIAASLDLVLVESSMQQQYTQILNCLSTMEHFECSRLR